MNPIPTVAKWHLFLVKLFLTTLMVGGATVSSGLSGTNWSAESGTQHVIFMAGVLTAIATNLLSLLDKTYSAILNGDHPEQPAVKKAVDAQPPGA